MVKKAGKRNVVRKTPKKKKKVALSTASASGTQSGRKRASGKKAARKLLRKTGKSPVIHCMLAPTEEDILLLPTSVLAEVVDFQQPSPMDDVPPWLIGQIEWDERQVACFQLLCLDKRR